MITKLFMAIALVMLTGLVNAQQKQSSMVTENNVSTKSTQSASFNWESTNLNLGKLEKGTPSTATFHFTNNGNDALIITNVSTSCGCTVADYTKEPVMPGMKGFVKATYNAANTGNFNKAVTITANTPEKTVQLIISGEVMENVSGQKK